MTAILPYDRETGKPVVIRDAKRRFATSQLRPPTIARLTMLATSLARSLAGCSSSSAPYFPPRPNIHQFPSIEEYAELLRRCKLYDHAVERQVSGTIIYNSGMDARTMLRDIAARLNPHASRINEVANFSVVGEEKPRYSVQPRDYLAELITLTRNFECYWNPSTNSLNVWTEPIVIVHPIIKYVRYQFGRMIIPIHSCIPKSVKPHAPRWARGEVGTFFHPHVDGSRSWNSLGGLICFGDGGDAVTRASRQGRLFDIVDMIISILKTYGRNPYSVIENWNGICDEKFDPATGQILGIDESVPEPPRQVMTCPDCAVVHDNPVSCCDFTCSKRDRCIGCLCRCQADNCDNYLCEDHTWVCGDCTRCMCASHFTNDDGEELCNDCYNN